MKPILTTHPAPCPHGPPMLVLALVASLWLGGCGQRGPLYFPDDAAAPARKRNAAPPAAPRQTPPASGDATNPSAPPSAPATPVTP
ncbi:MAG: lipoprotein [Lautropia sp.]